MRRNLSAASTTYRVYAGGARNFLSSLRASLQVSGPAPELLLERLGKRSKCSETAKHWVGVDLFKRTRLSQTKVSKWGLWRMEASCRECPSPSNCGAWEWGRGKGELPPPPSLPPGATNSGPVQVKHVAASNWYDLFCLSVLLPLSASAAAGLNQNRAAPSCSFSSHGVRALILQVEHL